jgi:hypothetical protein
VRTRIERPRSAAQARGHVEKAIESCRSIAVLVITQYNRHYGEPGGRSPHKGRCSRARFSGGSGVRESGCVLGGLLRVAVMAAAAREPTPPPHARAPRLAGAEVPKCVDDIRRYSMMYFFCMIYQVPCRYMPLHAVTSSA